MTKYEVRRVTLLSDETSPNLTLVVGTDCENKNVLQTIIDTASDRDRILAFNYASLSANNSFFLDSIVSAPYFFFKHQARA